MGFVTSGLQYLLDHIIMVSKVPYSLDQLTASFAHWSFRTLEFVEQKVRSCTVPYVI